MSLNSINRILTNNTLWVLFSFIALGIYLSPLFYDIFYVHAFDNLDSTIVWYKILAQSNKIFANNSEIIPNMMGGLPRLSYPNEFNIVLWLYYFFEPQTAYVINEITIHIVAFFSMYLFLNRYIVKPNLYYKNIPTFAGSIYFSLLPFWSGAGLSIAILPLVTYALLNIKHTNDNLWNWILIIILPFYTSFIFIYMFYIVMAGLYLIWDSIKNRKLNKPFLFAILLMGSTFLLSEYRLFMAMFMNTGFVSHRTEFNVYFIDTILESYRSSLVFFLDGHLSHLSGLQSFYVLPTIIIGMILIFIKRRLTIQESLLLYGLIVISFAIDFWKISLTQFYTLPILLLLALLALYNKQRRVFVLLFIFDISLSLYIFLTGYEGLHFITNIFPIFRELSILRLAFIQPFLLAILFTISLIVFTRKLRLSIIYITIIISFQIFISYEQSSFRSTESSDYVSFQQYYAPNIFKQIKEDINYSKQKYKIVSYGLESAVLQYNGIYTIGGYITNYPLSYKYDFRKVIQPYFDLNTTESNYGKHLYNSFGSKVYIMGTLTTLKYYKKNRVINSINFDINALCDLDTKFLISSYKFITPNINRLNLIKQYKGKSNSWDIYLYKINCL